VRVRPVEVLLLLPFDQIKDLILSGG